MADEQKSVIPEQKQDEFLEKEVIDPIEANFGDKAKAKKIVKVKKEAPAEPLVKEQGSGQGAEGEAPEKKIQVLPPVKPKDDKTDSEKKTEVKQEKKIEVPIDYFDPLDAPAKKVDAKQSEKTLKEDSPAVVVKTPEQLKDEANLTEYKRQAQLYQKLSSSPQGKFLLQLAEEGEDVMAAIQNLQPRDYQNMDEVSLAREYFTKIEGISGEELEAAVSEHLELPEGSNARRREVREFRSSLDYAQQQKLSKYQQDLTFSKTKGQELIPKFHSEVEKEIEESYVKKQAYGIKLTPDQAEALKESAKNIFKRLIDPDTGEVNAKVAAYYAFAEAHGRTLRKNDYLKGLTEGQEKILTAVTQPDRNEQSLGAPRRIEQEDDVERINRVYGGQPVKTN